MADPLDEGPSPKDDLVRDLGYIGPGVGAKRELVYQYQRDLSRADIAALQIDRKSEVPSLQQLRSSHHALARCIAAGLKTTQVSQVTGYTSARINQLSKDPAFTALVEDYRREAQSAFADLAERMKNVSLDAIEMLQERLSDSPETFSIPMLLDLVRAFADRTGYGPGQDVHVRVNHDYIDRPPREDFETWRDRRARELAQNAEGAAGTAPSVPKLLVGPTDPSKLN